MSVLLLGNGVLLHDGRLVARIVYAEPELAEAMRRAAETHVRQNDPGHTGAAASWCPICGDCTCPREPDGHWIDDPEAIARAYERRGECPLHRLSGAH